MLYGRRRCSQSIRGGGEFVVFAEHVMGRASQLGSSMQRRDAKVQSMESCSVCERVDVEKGTDAR
jgi:hypothetical protein